MPMMQREDTPIFIPSLDGNGSELPSSLPERSLVNSSWASIDLNDGGQSARNIAGASSPSYKTSRGEGILSTPLSFTPSEAVLRLGLVGAGLLVGSALSLAALLTNASGAATPLVIPGLAAVSAAGMAALRVKAMDRRIQAMAQQGIMGKAATDAAGSRSFGLTVSTLCRILRVCAALLPIATLAVTIFKSLLFSRTHSRLVVAALAVSDVMAGVGTWVLWDAATKLQEMGDKVDATSTSSLGDVEMPAAEESKQAGSRQ